MNADDRAAIEGLFGRLSQAEGHAPARDAEAEAFINDRIASQPAAPYFMAQTMVVQEHALAQAQARIEQLEAERVQAQHQPQSGGMFGGLFGGGAKPAPAQPQPPRPTPAAPPTPPAGMGGANAGSGPWGRQGAQGGGFLAGAAQTAMGVAGGILVANAIGGMMSGGDEAQAAEAPADDGLAAEEPPVDTVSAEDEGGGFFDGLFGDGDGGDFEI